MKKMILALSVSLMSVGAFASGYTSVTDLPAGTILDAMVDISGRPTCPKGYVVATKRCWNRSTWRFERCGYFCSKIPAPPRGGQH